jgi:hypothetical protein
LGILGIKQPLVIVIKNLSTLSYLWLLKSIKFLKKYMKYLSFFLLFTVFACKSDPKPAPNADVFKTLFINSQKVLCKGNATQYCLQYRDSTEQNWKLLYEPIKNFQYEEGFKYEIKVIERKVENPKPNALPVQYLLVREVRKTFDNVMSLKTSEEIDAWSKTVLESVSSLQPTEKIIKKDKKDLKIQVFDLDLRPVIVRSIEENGTGIIQEFYFYKHEVVLLRELIPGVNPIENRFYFHDKGFLKSLTRQTSGKMATEGIPFAPYKSKAGSDDYRLKFNSVNQEAFTLYGAK